MTVATACVIGFVGCGKGSSHKSTSTATQTTTTTKGKKGQGKKGPAKPTLTQQVRVIEPKSSKPGSFGTNGRAKPGSFVQLIVRPPADLAGKRLTIAIPKTTSRRISVQTSVAGQRKTTQISSPSGKIEVLDVLYSCQLPPATFCPLKGIERKPTSVRLRLKAKKVPIVLTLPIGRPGQASPARLIPTGLAAPGTPIQATVGLRRVGKGVKKPGLFADKASAGAGSLIQVLVRPEPNSPARGTLRIAIPHTSGQSIAVEAGGTAGKPASSATIKASGARVRVTGARWSCKLPPATFCPVGPISRTRSGLTLRLPTPRVPVVLALTLAQG